MNKCSKTTCWILPLSWNYAWWRWRHYRIALIDIVRWTVFTIPRCAVEVFHSWMVAVLKKRNNNLRVWHTAPWFVFRLKTLLVLISVDWFIACLKHKLSNFSHADETQFPDHNYVIPNIQVWGRMLKLRGTLISSLY